MSSFSAMVSFACVNLAIRPNFQAKIIIFLLEN
jgi:hypothetical protein